MRQLQYRLLNQVQVLHEHLEEIELSDKKAQEVLTGIMKLWAVIERRGSK